MESQKISNLSIKATQIVFISDIHFGIRQSSEEWQENLKDYFINWFMPFIRNVQANAGTTEKPIIVVLGDVFDDRKAIDINVSNLAIDIFEEIASILPVYIINGNHDLSKKTNKSNTSLRSLHLIPNVTVIKEPTYIKVTNNKKQLASIIAVPYLGSFEEESKYLREYSGKADYAFMHTEVAKMKMDNGMTITHGINSEVFSGTIYAGHIHRRQENGKVIYVGSPYQLTRGDIGNEKGIYVLDLKTKQHTYTPNNYSPIFHTIHIDKFIAMNASARREFMDNNYNYIIIEEAELEKYKKKIDIYNLKEGTTAKIARPIYNRIKGNVGVEDGKDYKELSIQELINDSINQLEVTPEKKQHLMELSSKYLKAAEEEIVQDI